MRLRSTLFTFGLIAALLAGFVPAGAERPLLDYHRLDAYFTLFAPDSMVPWKPATVRLDTYTSAPVDFSVYQVDPADVIVAGSTALPRAIRTQGRKPIARWRYTPPGGYRFQSNDVEVPLGAREGFFVVEARRGNVGEQVWLNRTRIGLLTKETARRIMLYAADLGTGRPLAHMRVSFIVNGRFSDRYTGRDGLLYWDTRPRPVFALAQWGSSQAFVSFLPQAPLPHTVVGVKTDSAVVHAGGELHVAGFARTLDAAQSLRPARGEAFITLRSRYGVKAKSVARLDEAGAFAATLHIPASSASGQYTVIAAVNGATAGTDVHVDANAAGLSLDLRAQCKNLACDSDADVPLVVGAMRFGKPAPGVTVAVDVIRSPHVYPPGVSQTPWGITEWYRTTVRTGADGNAVVRIPHPVDGLASTYGVHASAGGATADTRVVVPTAPIALRVQLEQSDVGSGTPARFDVYAMHAATESAVAHLPVRVQLVHGTSVQEQRITLDDHGHAHGTFSSPAIGSNLVIALANAQGRQSMDAAQLQVEPQTVQTQNAQSSENITIGLDRRRYRAGETAHVRARLSGAQGASLLTLETPERVDARIVTVSGGEASGAFRVAGSSGVLAAGAAFVRDGTLQWSSIPLLVDAPGRPLPAVLQLDKQSYAPGTDARVSIAHVRAGIGTLFVRITKGEPSGSALFTNAPELLAIGTTATQDTAAAGASWHPWVDSTGEHALIQTFARRTAPPRDLTLRQAATASLYWNVDRHSGNSVSIPVPAAPGTYVLSLLKVDEDGRVTAGSADLHVHG